MRANQITGPNASGPRQSAIRTPLAARVGQFRRSTMMDSHDAVVAGAGAPPAAVAQFYLGTMGASARFAVSFTALSLLLSACGRGDMDSASTKQIRKQLPGIWVFDAKYASGDDLTSTLTIVPDGSYVCRMTARTPTNGLQTVEIEGAFRVEDGFLIETIAKNSQTNGPVGTSSRARIVRIDDREMILEYETAPGVVTPTNAVVFRRQTE